MQSHLFVKNKKGREGELAELINFLPLKRGVLIREEWGGGVGLNRGFTVVTFP